MRCLVRTPAVDAPRRGAVLVVLTEGAAKRHDGDVDGRCPVRESNPYQL